MASLKQLFSQSVIYGLSTVVPRLLNYLLVPLHTRVFENPANYGVITELYAYITFLLILLTFGLETGFFRFASKSENRNAVYSTVFYTILATSSIATVLFYIFSGNIANALGSEFLPEYIIVLGFVVATDAFMSIPFAKLRLENKAFAFSSIKIIGVSVNVALNLLIYYCLQKGLFITYINKETILLLIFYANLVQNIVSIVLVLFIAKIPRIYFDTKLFKSITKYSLPLLIAGMAGTTNEAMDRIFIRFLLPNNYNALYELGIYGSNVKLAVLMLLFIQMYRFAAEPFFFKLHNSKDGTNSLFPKTQKYFIVFCLIIFLGITFNLPIIKYIVGVEYRKKMMIVPILLLSNILFGTFFNLSFWYKLTDKTLFGIKYTALGALITIISNIILIPLIGIYGAAVSRVICYGIMNILSYHDGKKTGLVKIETNNLNLYLFIFVAIVVSSLLLSTVNIVLSVCFANISILGFVYTFIKTEKIIVPLINPQPNESKNS